jgi:hypothetical protein
MKTKLSPGRLTATIASLSLLAAGVGGCASSRVLEHPLPSGATEAKSVSNPDGITVSVQSLILRNSAGSWLKNANWDEYVLKIDNESGDPCEIERISLASDKFDRPVPSSTARRLRREPAPPRCRRRDLDR